MRHNENLIRFCCSGVSCMSAGFITNPIDVIKVRLQLDNQLSRNANIFTNRYYKGFFRGGLLIVKDEGIAGLYKGVVASVMREGIYSTIRLGAYEPVKGLIGASEKHAPFWKKLIAGATTGAIGSAIANPTDLVKIRMQGQGRLKPGEKPRYVSTLSAFRDIIKSEGVRALWRGVGPTVQRATILTATQIPSYDHTKYILLHRDIMEEGLKLHMVASITAGFVTALVTSPVDVVKTRVMNEAIASKGEVVYRSSFSSLQKILKAEGVLGLYKGFIPNWMRIGPHTIITFLIFERLRNLVGLKPI